jgi:zinc finger protein
MGAESTNLFPTIGTVAAGTHSCATIDDEDQLAKGAKPTETENEERSVEEIESLCLQCHEQGMTRLLLTSIPFFREIIVMSFRCEHCGWQNNEIQSAGTIRSALCPRFTGLTTANQPSSI